MFRAAYTFSYNEETGAIRITDNHGMEMTPGLVEKLVQGLTIQYLDIPEEEKIQSAIISIENDFNIQLNWYGTPIIVKEFRKDIKRHWSFKCDHCEQKVSSKTHKKYWYGDTCLFQNIMYTRFCSKACSSSFINEIRLDFIKNEKQKIGLLD